MNDGYTFTLSGQKLTALPSGALWWEARKLLCVSDLHLCKSERIARRRGLMLPPYETRDTLDRLGALIDRLDPFHVVCLGDSFDDLDAAAAMDEADKSHLCLLQAGRDWVWIEGNHDPGPIDLGGRHLNALQKDGLLFRHIAERAASGEVSGHYHPKCSPGRGGTRPAFLIDGARVIMPAFGAFTGGLRATHPHLTGLMGPDATAVLTGRRAMPMPFAAAC
jgi:DNA ligase-associated metallophosphoesterase